MEKYETRSVDFTSFILTAREKKNGFDSPFHETFFSIIERVAPILFSKIFNKEIQSFKKSVRS